MKEERFAGLHQARDYQPVAVTLEYEIFPEGKAGEIWSQGGWLVHNSHVNMYHAPVTYYMPDILFIYAIHISSSIFSAFQCKYYYVISIIQ